MKEQGGPGSEGTEIPFHSSGSRSSIRLLLCSRPAHMAWVRAPWIPTRWAPALCPFLRHRTWHAGKASNLAKTWQLAQSRAGMWTEAVSQNGEGSTVGGARPCAHGSTASSALIANNVLEEDASSLTFHGRGDEGPETKCLTAVTGNLAQGWALPGYPDRCGFPRNPGPGSSECQKKGQDCGLCSMGRKPVGL